MQTVIVPGHIWVNLIILVAAAIFVGVKLATAKSAGRRKPASKPASASLRRAIK